MTYIKFCLSEAIYLSTINQIEDIMWKKTLIIVIVFVIGLFIFLESYTPPLSEYHGSVQTELFLGQSENQALIVGFGGGEGGNAWSSNYWKPIRDRFIDAGYAFLAVGYFGGEETPQALDRISLNAIHDAIMEATKSSDKIDAGRIVVIGGSKGAELVLNLASYFDNIDVVVALSPSHATFPAITWISNTSSWTLNGQELPYVPTPYSAVPAMISTNHLEAFNIMLADTKAVEQARIPVENIKGSVLLISSDKDEMWPSAMMGNSIIERLEAKQFSYPYEHIVVEGGHTAPKDHFDLVFDFIDKSLNITVADSLNTNQ